VLDKAARDFSDSVVKTIENEGKPGCLKVYKDVLQVAKQLVLKVPITPVSYRKSSKEGIPRVLKPLVPFLTSDQPNEVRIALTIVRIIDLIKVKPNPNLEAITAPGRGPLPLWIPGFNQWLKRWMKLNFRF